MNRLTYMMRSLRYPAGLLACAFVLAGCSQPPALAPTPAAPSINPAAAAGLPPLAQLDALPRGSAAVGADRLVLNPAEYVACSHGVQPLETQALLPRGPRTAYAIYALDPPQLPWVIDAAELSLTCDTDNAAWCCLANYASGRWELHQLGTAGPDPQVVRITPRAEPSAYRSPAGRTFLTVISYDSDLLLSKLDIELRDSTPLPAPGGLTASPQLGGALLTWDSYPDPRADMLELRITAPGGYVRTTALGPAAVSERVYGLAAGTEYSATLRAVWQAAGQASAPGPPVSVAARPGWIHAWSGPSEITQLEPLPGGTFIAIGWTFVPGEASLANLMHLDSSGAILVQRAWRHCRLNGLAVAANSIYLAGSGFDSFGQAVLLKLDMDLEVQWVKHYSFPGIRSDVAALALDSTGNILLAVNTEGSVWGMDSRPVYAKCDPAGELLWQRASPETSNGHVHAVSLSANGTAYFAGNSLVSIGPDGGLNWERSLSYAGTGFACGTALAQPRNAGVWIAAATQAGGTWTTVLGQFDADGNLMGQGAYPGQQTVGPRSLLATSAGDLWLAGRIQAAGGSASRLTQWSGALQLLSAASWRDEVAPPMFGATALAALNNSLICYGAGAGVLNVSAALPPLPVEAAFVAGDPGIGLVDVAGSSEPFELEEVPATVALDPDAGTALAFCFTP